MSEHDPAAHRGQDQRTQRAALIGLAICLALVLAGLFLFYQLKKSSDLQDCTMQGRTNCAPVDTSQ
jgi:type VI protein secretion system component VasF